MPAEDVPSHLGDGFKRPPPEPILCQSMQQRFESKYFKHLNASEGTTDGQMTHPNEMAKAAIEDLFEGTTHMGECPDDDADVFTMVACVAEVEALDLSMVNEARSRSDWGKWEMVIKSKFKSPVDTHMWKVVGCPRGVNVVGCKWVFKIKRNTVGEIDKYKA